MNKKKMKRRIAIVLCLILAWTFSGCGKQDDDTTQAITEKGTEAEQEISSEERTDTNAPTDEVEGPVKENPTDGYKIAYLDIIRENRPEIMSYNWQYGYAFYAQDVITPTPISIVDVTGDDIPELIFMKAIDNVVASLHIYTYQEGEAQEIYTNTLDVAVGGGSYYVLFQIEGSHDLYIRCEAGDETWETRFAKCGFDEFGNYGIINVLEETMYPNEDYTDMISDYTENEGIITKETYQNKTNELLDSMSVILLYNEHFSEEITALVNNNQCTSMTYLEAYNYLSEGSEDITTILKGIPSFYFSSGVGGWGTSLDIYADGSFEGSYHDSDMGDIGEGYSNGTVYLSDFRGSFTDIKKVNDYTYTMKLQTIELEKEPGTEWIEKEARYIASEPYGMDNAEEVYLYLPGAPTAELPSDFLDWVSMPRGWVEEDIPVILDGYGLYNPNERTGFYAD